eukprot:1966464-Pyramimonas_sp.AAC.1
MATEEGGEEEKEAGRFGERAFLEPPQEQAELGPPEEVEADGLGTAAAPPPTSGPGAATDGNGAVSKHSFGK